MSPMWMGGSYGAGNAGLPGIQSNFAI